MTITQEEIETEDENEVIPFKYSISSYGADFTVDSLVKRIEDGSIYVPSFQRGYVWNIFMASRFIESLLLDLPVPGIFLLKEAETQKLMVIDGQQRLRTLQYFYKGIFEPSGKKFALQGVVPEFSGLTYAMLKYEDQRRLDDSILHATIVKQDRPFDDDSSIFEIFLRLNTGGIPLKSQEIRSAIYHGEFSDLLKELNENETWRSLYGNINSRMQDQQLILRFLALYFNIDNYKKPMTRFLNRYMGENRHLKIQSAEEIKKIFTNTIELVVRSLGKNAFKPKRKLNSAIFDAVMVGIARKLERGDIHDVETLRERYESLLKNPEFSDIVFKGGTNSEDSVKIRIRLATEAFIDLQ